MYYRSRFGAHVENSASTRTQGKLASAPIAHRAISGGSNLSSGGPVAGSIAAPSRGRRKSEFLVCRIDAQYFATQMELGPEKLGKGVTIGEFRRKFPPPPTRPPRPPNKIWRLTELPPHSARRRMGCPFWSKSCRRFSHIPSPAYFTRILHLHIDSAYRTRDCSAIGDPHRNVSHPIRGVTLFLEIDGASGISGGASEKGAALQPAPGRADSAFS